MDEVKWTDLMDKSNGQQKRDKGVHFFCPLTLSIYLVHLFLSIMSM